MTENIQPEVCYFCGRRKSDFHMIFQSILDRVERDIDEKEHAIQAQLSSRDAEKSRRDKVLDEYSNVDESKLELKIATIKTDVSTFGNLLPLVEDIIQFSDRCEAKEPDLDVRDVLKEVPGFGYETWEQNVKRLHADLDVLKLKKTHVAELAADVESIAFEKKSFRIDSLFQSSFFQLDQTLTNGVAFMKQRFKREPLDFETLFSEMGEESAIRSKNRNSAQLPDGKVISEKRDRLLQGFTEVSQLDFSIAICPICSGVNQEILRRAQSN